MNIFGGIGAGDGSHTLTRRILLASVAIGLAALGLAVTLEQTTKDRAAWLMGRDQGALLHALRQAPRAGDPVTGVRYGEVDYLPTASVSRDRRDGAVGDRPERDGPRWKNVVADPSLGLPPGFSR